MTPNFLEGDLKHSAHERLDTLVGNKDDDSDDELVNAFSPPGPARSRPSTRSSSSRGTPGRLAHKLALTASAKQSTDPLRVFPTEISQRIFTLLGTATSLDAHVSLGNG
ncbi:hypothetical protein V8E52_003284, partial [Russula decolorans]